METNKARSSRAFLRSQVTNSVNVVDSVFVVYVVLCYSSAVAAQPHGVVDRAVLTVPHQSEVHPLVCALHCLAPDLARGL